MCFCNYVLGSPGETAFRATDQAYDNDKQYKKVITVLQNWKCLYKGNFFKSASVASCRCLFEAAWTEFVTEKDLSMHWF